jgi:pimeloyl-ACP methyl ester carboxylesterase
LCIEGCCANWNQKGELEIQTLKKVFGVIFVLLIGLIVLGFTYQSVQQNKDRANFPAPGELYDIDDMSLHLDCRGDGSPTLVMEAGLTSGSFSWGLVHDELASVTQVCAYDRPGMDWSAPINRVADAKEVSDRFNQLLNKAEVVGPKILLGMSAGGVYVREFYKNHPQDIVGMVFVDSSHEQQANRLPPFEGADTYANMINACRMLQPLGVVRISGLLNQFLDQYGLDEATKQGMLANMNQSHTCSAMHWEIQSFTGEIKDELPPTTLGDLPLLVLSQGEESKAMPESGVTLEQARAQRDVWNVLQLELTDLSSNGRRFVAKKSGHVIQLDQPELLIETVNAFVLELRDAVE